MGGCTRKGTSRGLQIKMVNLRPHFQRTSNSLPGWSFTTISFAPLQKLSLSPNSSKLVRLQINIFAIWRMKSFRSSLPRPRLVGLIPTKAAHPLAESMGRSTRAHATKSFEEARSQDDSWVTIATIQQTWGEHKQCETTPSACCKWRCVAFPKQYSLQGEL